MDSVCCARWRAAVSTEAPRPAAATAGACPACGSTARRPAPGVRGFAFTRCGECRTLWCQNPPPPERTAEVYADVRYFLNPDFGSPETGGYHGYRDYLADREHIQAKFDQILAHVEALRPPGDLLDVGAGPGFLLAAARARGWQPVGFDLNPWATAHAVNELGLDVRAQALGDAELDDRSFDAVTMMDLLEHVPDPAALVGEAARLTRPGGVLAVLTPNAASPVSRALGGRWPELQRAPEHLVLFSPRGLAALLARHGWAVQGWHSIGKESDVATLIADVSPAAPAIGGALNRVASATGLDERVLDLDPHTKFCLYAVRAEAEVELRPLVRVPKRHVAQPSPEEAVFEDLQVLGRAERLTDWMFAQYRAEVRGLVAEVGAGIGTFTERILAGGAREVLAMEPEPACAAALERRFAADDRVTVSRDSLPAAPSLDARTGDVDLIVCQNVLEHIAEQEAAVAAMASALAPGGHLALIVPAHPRLFGPLDLIYGHRRRYTAGALRALLTGAELDVCDLHAFNLLGIPGWWVKNRRAGAQIGATSLRVYEALVGAWRPFEERVRPPWGLSLVAIAERRR